jgi:asparagine synthase (glutamine-hydrolysing)
VLRAGASRIANALPEPRSGSLEITRLKRFLRAGDGPAAARYAEYVSRLSDADFRQLRTHGLSDRHVTLFAQTASAGAADGALRQALRIDYGVYLPDDLLALSDRIASAHSLEVRVPFVDHHLVDQLFPLPDDLRIRGSRQKWVLREAVRERLTPAHFTAPKRGFVGPTASWLRNELRQVLTDELSTARLERLGLFEPVMVERLLREHFDRTANHEGVLWGLLVFSIWHRQMVETPNPT